jgi:hypothetical protein
VLWRHDDNNHAIASYRIGLGSQALCTVLLVNELKVAGMHALPEAACLSRGDLAGVLRLESAADAEVASLGGERVLFSELCGVSVGRSVDEEYTHTFLGLLKATLVIATETEVTSSLGCIVGGDNEGFRVAGRLVVLEEARHSNLG